MSPFSAYKSVVFCLGACLLAAVPALALEPYQHEALDTLLADVEPASRPIMQAQFESLLATMGPD